MKFILRGWLCFLFSACIAWGSNQSGIPYINNQPSFFSNISNKLVTNSSVSFFSSNQYSGASLSYQTSYKLSPISMLNSKINLINYSSDGLSPNNLINYDFNFTHRPTDNLYLSIGFSGFVGDQTINKVKPY